MSYTRAWKFLLEPYPGLVRSRHGEAVWELNAWQPEVSPVSLCHQGYHASPRILDALGYVQGGVLARVEVRGESASEGDKSVHAQMRAVRLYRWTPADSVSLAIYAAELVLDLYERQNPGDDRPRKAIEAAKAYLANPTDAAYAASSAASRAAYDAAYAASDAAYAASSAASSADRAASSAAYDAASRAASDAAYNAASSAASDAAREEIRGKIEKFLLGRVRKLEVLS